MTGPAAARATLCELRHAIAKIEERPAERLTVPGAAGGTEGNVLRRAGIAGPACLPTGAEGFDAALGGGLPRAALTEIHGAETRDAGAVAGFALALAARIAGQMASPVAGPMAGGTPLLWVATGEAFAEAGSLYAPGI